MEMLLRISLSAAVLLWIEELKKIPLSEVLRRGPACAQIVAEKGDRIMFKSRKGETAHAFNRLAEGLAVMSFVPGGVKFLELHFEAQHPDGGK